jgi:hypothetical protein
MTNDLDDMAASGRWMLFVAVILGIILVGGTFVYWLLAPTWHDMRTETREHSAEYVSTKKELLVKLKQDVGKLDVRIAESKGDDNMVQALQGQRKATIDRMKQEATTIEPKAIPSEVARFLETDGK